MITFLQQTDFILIVSVESYDSCRHGIQGLLPIFFSSSLSPLLVALSPCSISPHNTCEAVLV